MQKHLRNPTTLASLVAFALAVPAGALAWTTAVQADTVEVPEEHEDEIACMVELAGDELADIQAEEDALHLHLQDLGIEHSYEDLGGVGFRVVEWDYEDEAANDAVEDFWVERYPLAPDEVAAMNADSDELAVHLTAAGVDYTVDTDADGVRWVEWDEDDPVAEAAVDAFYAPTPEDIAEMNAEEDGLAAHLAAAGIEHTVTTDPDGSRWVEWDYEDEAANAAADEYYVGIGYEPGMADGLETEMVACEG